MAGREGYTWRKLCRDLPLCTHLTARQAMNLVGPLEREAQLGNDQVTHPYDLLQPLTVILDPAADYETKGKALRTIVLRLPDERDGT